MGNVGYEEKCLEYIIQKIAPAIALWPKLARISFQELALKFDEGGILVTKKSDPLSAVFEHFSYFYKFDCSKQFTYGKSSDTVWFST